MSKFVTLLVEDDALQREVLSDVLRAEKYEVIECATGEAAELVVATTGTELQALVTDQNLGGGMSGAELAEYAREKFPRMNVILMSGQETPRLPPSVLFLRKPFPPPALLAAIRKSDPLTAHS